MKYGMGSSAQNLSKPWNQEKHTGIPMTNLTWMYQSFQQTGMF